jgi:hypothetical protein
MLKNVPWTLFCVSAVYAFGALYVLGLWIGWLNYDPTLWVRASFPFFVTIFLVGAISGFAVLLGRKVGVYGLAVAWIGTLITGLLFPASISFGQLVVGAVLIVLCVLEIRQRWATLS